MSLNKVNPGSNMYQDLVTHTWNTVRGACPFSCKYCYVQSRPQGPLHFAYKEMFTNLGFGRTIFVGSSCDMFAPDVSSEWIICTLERCLAFSNAYLFQSKNPKRMAEMWQRIVQNLQTGHLFTTTVQVRLTTFATTIESNRDYPDISKAPKVTERAEGIIACQEFGKTMVTIEPILDFDLEPLASLLTGISPEIIAIGADSKGHGLPEPSGEQVIELVTWIKKHLSARIILKSNLKRLLGSAYLETLQAYVQDAGTMAITITPRKE